MASFKTSLSVGILACILLKVSPLMAEGTSLALNLIWEGEWQPTLSITDDNL